jgi:glycine/D-amino acid oxidase-like deaminating enzyme
LPKTNYGTVFWTDTFPASRRPAYPKFRGTLRTDVAIVGGGAIGCAVAYVFAAAGIDVALFEQGRVGQGQATRGTGIALHDPEPSFHSIAAQHGLRDARHIYRIARRGSLEYVAALRRLRIECGLQIRDGLHCSSSPDGVARLEKEYQARRDAGLEVAALKGTALFRRTGMSGFGLVTHGNASVNPYKATLGLARAAAARNARVFEHSPVTRIRPLRRTVEIRTQDGIVTASKVVVASGFPTDDFKPLWRRFSRCDGYVVLTPELPAPLRRAMTPDGLILRDTASPDHWLHWVGNRVLFSGADQASLPARAKERALIQRTGQLMYELSVMRPPISGLMPQFAWDLEYSRTADGVPYFGPHRNYPHHYFAFGGGPGGIGQSFTAARIILRHFLGKEEKGDEPFSFTRIRE